MSSPPTIIFTITKLNLQHDDTAFDTFKRFTKQTEHWGYNRVKPTTSKEELSGKRDKSE